MSITSVVNDLVTSVSVINALKPLPPTISGYSVAGKDDLALDPAGGQTVQINGTGFLPGATITFDGSAIAVVTYVNPNQLSFTSPAKTAGTYTIYAVNPDGGTAIYVPGIIYSTLPTWTTAAGSLGSYYETTSISNTVVAAGDAPVTYSLYSGSLPTGSTLAANGVITGTAPVDSSSTTYSFTIQASDAQLQDSTRSFSLTINVDAVTWVSPANNTTYTSAVDSAIANVTLSATDAAGYAVSYSANALPTGLSLTGSNIAGTPTVIADSSTLLTATAATTNRTATRTINWSITVANDPYFEYNTLLIPGASTTFVDDASTNNFAVTINGDTKPNNFNPYTPGYYSNYFDGTGDYLQCAYNSAFDLSSSDFTIESWVNTTDSSSNYPSIIGRWQSAGNACWDFRPRSTDIGNYFVFVYSTNGTTPVSVNSNTVITDGVWHHLVAVRSGNNFALFVDGIRKQTASFTGVTIFNSVSSPLYVGYDPYGATYYTGYQSNTRLVKGTAVYDPTLTTLTVPTTPLTAIANTSLLTCQSNRFIDNSTNNFTITVNGNTLISSFDPFVPNSSYSTYGSGYFDGTGDYLSVPNNAAFDLPGDFTVEVWFNFSTISGAHTFIGNYAGASTGWALQYRADDGNVFRFSYGNTTILNSPATTVLTNTWYHLAVTRSGSTVKMFLNGTQTATATSATSYTSSAALWVGGLTGVGQYTNGYIVDARIVKGTAVYTTTFTPPSAPLTAIANTSLLVLQNNQSVNNSVFLDNSTNNFFVTRAGNTTQGTFSPYGGNWSNYFGGQMVSTLSPSSTKFNLTGDFTLEAYVFLTALPGGDWGILDARVSGATASPWLYSIGGNGKLTFYDGSAKNGATTVTLNTWHHVAWVRNGSVLRGYLDGVLDYYNGSYGTGAISPGSTAPAIGTKDYGIGSYGTTGYISNLRVVNGTAVYTTSSTTVGATIFTPSTTPLTPITNTVLLSCADSRFIDDSVNNYTITPSSTTISVQRFSPFNPSSVTPTSYSGYFGSANGNSLYLSAQSTGTGGVTLTGNYTIEFWLYPTGTSSSGYSMVVGTNTDGNYLQYYYNSSGQIGYYTPGFGDVKTSASTTTLNTWQHIALVRSSNVTKVYVNGVEKAFSSAISDTSTIYANYIGGLGTAYNTLGYISNFRITNTAVYTTTFTPSTTPLTAISGTQLLTLQSATFIDNSTNNYSISVAGSPQPTIQNPFGYTSATTNGYTVSTIGGSAYYDGSGDSIASPQSATFNLSSGNWTIEAWYYSFSILGQSARYLTITPSSGSVLGVLPGSGGFILNVFGSSSPISTSIPAKLYAWQHIALVKNGSTTTLYIDGVAGGSGTPSWVNADTTIFFGGNTGSYAYDYSGYISDARVVKGTALYTSNFVPPSAPLTAIQNTSFLLNMTSAGIYDAAMMNNMETVGDAKLSTAVSKFGGSSMYFDGTGDYLTAPFNPSFNLGAGNFTIEFWINTTSTTAYATALRLGDTWTTGSWSFYVNDSNGSGYPSWWSFTLNNALITSGATVNDGSWHHIALVRNGATMTMYIDGTSRGTLSVSTSSVGDTTTKLWIGRDASNVRELTGYMDDLRITNGYARYTSNFTPPSSAFQLF